MRSISRKGSSNARARGRSPPRSSGAPNEASAARRRRSARRCRCWCSTKTAVERTSPPRLGKGSTRRKTSCASCTEKRKNIAPNSAYGGGPAAPSVAGLPRVVSEADQRRKRRLMTGAGRVQRELRSDPDARRDGEVVVDQVLAAAAELRTEDEAGRIRERDQHRHVRADVQR